MLLRSEPIQRYGGGAFTLGEQVYTGSVLVLPGGVRPWEVVAFEAVSIASLSSVVEHAAEIEIVLIGAGAAFYPLPQEIKMVLKSYGIAVECMDTGAACRTYNFLLEEGRKVAAALIAV